MLDVNNERVFEDHCLLQKGEASPLHPRAVSGIIPGNDFQNLDFKDDYSGREGRMGLIILPISVGSIVWLGDWGPADDVTQRLRF
jgi:hypothetical protein